MRLWILGVIAVLLLLWTVRERFVDPDRPVTRPSLTDAAWKSKVDAEAPIDGNDADYIRVLQAFYDTVYVPSESKPRDVRVEQFLNSTDAAGVDKEAMRRIIISSFSIERTTTAAQREEQQVRFKPTAAIQPKGGVDPLARPEGDYNPADPRPGDVPEGVYAPVEQQANPRRPGHWDDKSTSWTDTQFMSVVER